LADIDEPSEGKQAVGSDPGASSRGSRSVQLSAGNYRSDTMTIYCYDTEFLKDGRTIELISIGIVCEDGRET
jgi:hypothetical protein